MKIIYTLIFLLSAQAAFLQTIKETEIFNLKYKGPADAYFLKYDKSGSNYAYVYRINDENKNFIISLKGLSDKYDYVEPLQIIFDQKGNYYTVGSDYKEDYGTDNYFLIVNGEQIKNYNYIEQYSSYLNKKNEYVFVFKTGEKYRLGYYSIKSGFRQSGEFDNIRPAFNSEMLANQTEGDMVAYDEKYFFKNKNGERAFIATKNGKSSIIFDSEVIKTNYSDINEGSLIYNKNNELSYIAKKTGRFYEFAGNELVVSGSKEYNSFDMVTLPLMFNNNNEPVYVAGDSVADYKFSSYVVIGNNKQSFPKDEGISGTVPEFTYGISDLNINRDGTVSYVGSGEIVVPSTNGGIDGTSYDDYYSISYLSDDNKGYELGYNLNKIKYSPSGDMLYSAIASLEKKERLLLLNYGASRIIINKEKFDDIYEYGYTPKGEIFYIGQTYEDSALNKKYESSLIIGNKTAGVYNFIAYQYYGDTSYILTFGSGDKYAFAAEKFVDSANVDYVVVTNDGELPFPSNYSKTNKFYYISNLMYSKNDKLFYIADTKLEPETYVSTKEAFVNNVSLGKTYNTVFDFKYDELINEASFTASRGNVIYLVTVKF